MSDLSVIRTSLPCPAWCILPAGHGFHSLTEDGSLFRSHEGPDRSSDNMAIGMVADETARSDSGPIVTLESPTVFVSTDDLVNKCRFTGPELRRGRRGPLERGRRVRPDQRRLTSRGTTPRRISWRGVVMFRERGSAWR